MPAKMKTPRNAPALMAGDEVDFVIEHGRRVIAFLSHHPDAVAGVLLYCGDEIMQLGEKVIALPWQMIAGA
jgi:hypothetical protein